MVLSRGECVCLMQNTSFYSYPENIPDTEEVEAKPMIIGTNNVFEVGCCILLKTSI